MVEPSYELVSFSTVAPEERIAILTALLEALMLSNVFYLQHRPSTAEG